MVAISIAYKGDLHCRAIHGPSGSALETDAPLDNQGRGERFSPTDLVATALATCILTTMAIKARSMGLELNGAKAEVDKEMSAAPPRRIARLPVTIAVPLALSADDVLRLERAANACPVHKSLHPDIEVPIRFIWGG